MSVSLQHFGVIGAGAWGSALAQTLARAGRDVTLWAFEPDVVRAINATHENTLYLPGVALDPSVKATDDLAALAGCGAVLAVAPAQHLRATLSRFRAHAAPGLPVVLCAKGIEQDSLKLMSDVLAEEIPQARAAVLSGPSFANDVARSLPAAVTLACDDGDLGAMLADAMSRPEFRLYLTHDLAGAEIGGAVKNVLAIAAGICEGRELGKSAHAALVTRGFAEMTRLGVAMGAAPETLTGLCGLGDLILTCSSPQSRNMSAGIALGRGASPEGALSASKGVVEGAASAPAVTALARRNGADMPICAAVDDVLAGRMTLDRAIAALLARPTGAESG